MSYLLPRQLSFKFLLNQDCSADLSGFHQCFAFSFASPFGCGGQFGRRGSDVDACLSGESEVFSLETACLTVSVKDWADATGMKLDVPCPYSESGCSKSMETKPFTHTTNITSSGCFLKFNAWPCHQGFHIFVSHGPRMNSLILISLVHTGFEHIFHKRRVARVSGTCLRIPFTMVQVSSAVCQCWTEESWDLRTFLHTFAWRLHGSHVL